MSLQNRNSEEFYRNCTRIVPKLNSDCTNRISVKLFYMIILNDLYLLFALPVDMISFDNIYLKQI